MTLDCLRNLVIGNFVSRVYFNEEGKEGREGWKEGRKNGGREEKKEEEKRRKRGEKKGGKKRRKERRREGRKEIRKGAKEGKWERKECEPTIVNLFLFHDVCFLSKSGWFLKLERIME